MLQTWILALLCLATPVYLHLLSQYNHYHPQSPFEGIVADHGGGSDVSFETRTYWMRRAVSALEELYSPCPFAAFGTAIVNHTQSPEGELICIGINSIEFEGNPSLHGEIAGIRNCSKVLIDPDGPYKLTPEAAVHAFSTLSLYTTAEPCAMCASAIRWSGFAECIYATSIDMLVLNGWKQIGISSHELFARSLGLPSRTVLLGDVLSNETDGLFAWQYNSSQPCPKGCERARGTCRKIAP